MTDAVIGVCGGCALVYFAVMGVLQIVLLAGLGLKGWTDRKEWWFEEPGNVLGMAAFLAVGVRFDVGWLVWLVLIALVIYLASIGVRLLSRWALRQQP